MATAARSQLAPRAAGRVLRNVYEHFLQHNCFTYSAALAFYFLMSFFPFLILLGTTVAYLPVPRLFDRFLHLIGRMVPPEGMKVVHYVIKATLQTNATLLSASLLTIFWAAAGGFNAMSSALNVAYEVKETRSLPRRRFLALLLTCIIGLMVTIAMTAMALGPRFGFWLSAKVGVAPTFAAVWPNLRWAITMLLIVSSIEMLYFLGPNLRQTFRTQLPGAFVATAIWLFSSAGLGWYLRHIVDFSKVYGGLGAVVALMMWFYISAIAVLAGAELNAELKRCGYR